MIPMHIEVNGISKSFGSVTAVEPISFSVGKGKLIGLLGPSGGGKTTILRMLAGLEEPDTGDILFDGQKVNGLPPQKRGIGFVFQNYALFGHMSVIDNIAFGLKVKKWTRSATRDRVLELLELTGLTGLGRRLPSQLSGGQRQRVAFARALAPQPQLLLLDEPFAAIDAKVRKELRTWLRAMIDRVGVTTIFVTHDQEEAVEVADEILVVNRGRLEQKGTPLDIYMRPDTAFVASFIGESNEIADIATLRGFEDAPRGARAIIRPEYVEIGSGQQISSPSASDLAVVLNVYYRGTNWLLEVEAGRQRLFAYRLADLSPFQPGDEVRVLVHRAIVCLGDKTVMLENALKADPMPVHI